MQLALQWSAALIALTGSYLVSSPHPHERFWGFLLYLIANILWILWAGMANAWGLLTMNAAFCATSIRGLLASGW